MNNELKEGIYKGCERCTTHSCCKKSAGGYFTPPWVLPIEAMKIKELVGDNIDFFENPKEGETFGRMKRDANEDCIFLTDEGCSLLDYRPYDCKLFPYEVLHTKDGYFLVIYKHVCPNNITFDENYNRIIKLALQHSIPPYALEENEILAGSYKILCKLPVI